MCIDACVNEEKMIGKNCNNRQANAMPNKMQEKVKDLLHEAIVKSQSNRYLLDYTAFSFIHIFKVRNLHVPYRIYGI